MKLDDVFTSKEEIANDVKEELTKAMGERTSQDCNCNCNWRVAAAGGCYLRGSEMGG